MSPGTFPVAVVNSAQPFGQAGRLNDNTVCSGSSFASAGSEAATRTENDKRKIVRMDAPILNAKIGTGQC